MARSDLLQRALLEAALRTDPQLGSVRSLQQSLLGEYQRSRRVNRSNAAGLIEAVRQARPEVGGAFDEALASGQAQRTALGVAVDDPQAAAFQRRVGEAKAGALNDLTDRATRAAEGQVYANQSARDEYFGSKAKLSEQAQSLLAQRGQITASELGKLEDQEFDRGIDAGRLSETQRHNRAMEANARRTAARAKKPKLASTEAHAAARDAISRAVSSVEDLRQDTTSRAEIIKLLISGVPAVKKDGVELAPAIKPLPADFVRAAVNLAFDGSLSAGDVKRLHNRRLRVRSLGYRTRRSRPKQGMVDALAQLAGGAAQARVGG